MGRRHTRPVLLLAVGPRASAAGAGRPVTPTAPARTPAAAAAAVIEYGYRVASGAAILASQPSTRS
jgi:hypothetical protein